MQSVSKNEGKNDLPKSNTPLQLRLFFFFRSFFLIINFVVHVAVLKSVSESCCRVLRHVLNKGPKTLDQGLYCENEIRNFRQKVKK